MILHLKKKQHLNKLGLFCAGFLSASKMSIMGITFPAIVIFFPYFFYIVIIYRHKFDKQLIQVSVLLTVFQLISFTFNDVSQWYKLFSNLFIVLFAIIWYEFIRGSDHKTFNLPSLFFGCVVGSMIWDLGYLGTLTTIGNEFKTYFLDTIIFLIILILLLASKSSITFFMLTVFISLALSVIFSSKTMFIVIFSSLFFAYFLGKFNKINLKYLLIFFISLFLLLNLSFYFIEYIANTAYVNAHFKNTISSTSNLLEFLIRNRAVTFAGLQAVLDNIVGYGANPVGGYEYRLFALELLNKVDNVLITKDTIPSHSIILYYGLVGGWGGAFSMCWLMCIFLLRVSASKLIYSERVILWMSVLLILMTFIFSPHGSLIYGIIPLTYIILFYTSKT